MSRISTRPGILAALALGAGAVHQAAEDRRTLEKYGAEVGKMDYLQRQKNIDQNEQNQRSDQRWQQEQMLSTYRDLMPRDTAGAGGIARSLPPTVGGGEGGALEMAAAAQSIQAQQEREARASKAQAERDVKASTAAEAAANQEYAHWEQIRDNIRINPIGFEKIFGPDPVYQKNATPEVVAGFKELERLAQEEVKDKKKSSNLNVEQQSNGLMLDYMMNTGKTPDGKPVKKEKIISFVRTHPLTEQALMGYKEFVGAVFPPDNNFMSDKPDMKGAFSVWQDTTAADSLTTDQQLLNSAQGAQGDSAGVVPQKRDESGLTPQEIMDLESRIKRALRDPNDPQVWATVKANYLKARAAAGTR